MNAFSGAWLTDSQAFPGASDYLVVDARRGRVITFCTFQVAPVKRGVIPAWYEPMDDTRIRARIKPTDPWREHPIRFSDGSLILRSAGHDTCWKPLSESDRPDWLDQQLDQIHARMDDMERVVRAAQERPR